MNIDLKGKRAVISGSTAGINHGGNARVDEAVRQMRQAFPELMRRNVAQVVEREGKGRSVEEAMDEFRKGNPQGRMMQPEEIAALAVFLCSDLARGITMETIQVTGGALW